jgi:hypothetical protein
MSQHTFRIGGAAPIFFEKQPYYLKHMPCNPAFGLVHDGTTTAYGKGFTVKPIHWLYRFRWNSQHRGAGPTYLRNPGGKWMHWLEVSTIKKGIAGTLNHEAQPHVICGTLVILFTIWHLTRYLFFHPEVSLYYVVMYPTKNWVTTYRYNERHPMDKPVFRWMQRNPEFYWYDSYRDLIKLGILANDPYVDYMKSIGRERDLTLYMDQKGWGEGGQGKIVDLLPYEWRREPKHHGDHH